MDLEKANKTLLETAKKYQNIPINNLKNAIVNNT